MPETRSTRLTPSILPEPLAIHEGWRPSRGPDRQKRWQASSARVSMGRDTPGTAQVAATHRKEDDQMKLGSLIRRSAKWAATGAFVLVLACWATSVRFDLRITRQHSVHMNEGGLSVKMWPWGSVEDTGGPDTRRAPFWFLALALLVPAASLWAWDRARTPRAVPRPACPACGRRLA